VAGERTVKIKFVGDESGLKQSAERGEAAVSKWSKGVEKASRAAGAAAAIGGAAIAAALASAVGAGLEQSQIKAKLAAQLGATGPAAKLAGDAAGDLYARGVVSSMEEAANAVKTVFQNGLVPKDAGKAEIDAVAGRVSALAVTLDEEASAVGRAVSQMVKTGIADSSEEAFNILAKGTQLGINKSEDLLDTFNEYGTQFRKLGLEGPQALGLLNQAIQAGARDSDVAADALKEFSIRAIDGSKTTADGFKALGLDGELMGKNIARGGDFANEALDVTLDKLRSIKDPVKRNAAAVALFGTQAEDLGDALFALDPSAATKSIGALGGAADKAGKTLEQSAGAKVAAFQRQLQGGLITALAAVVGWIERNETLVKNLAMVLGPLVGIIAAVVAITKVYTVVQAALNVVLALNPIGLVVLAIAALVAGMILLYKNSETVRKVVDGAFKGIAAAGKWLWESAIKPYFGFIMNIYKTVGQAAVWLWKNGIVPAFNGVKAAVVALWNGYKTYIGFVITVIKAIPVAVTNMKNDIVARFNAVVSFVSGLKARIGRATGGLWDGIKNSFRNAINYIVDAWNRLSFSLPSINTPFGKIGGTTLNTPNIPRLATGGWMQPGRTYLTGENGPELLTSSRRAYVNNAGDTAAMAGGGAPAVHVYIGERELTDIVDVRVTHNNRQTRRAAGARLAGATA
jgi:phage-related minor tail protein